MKKLSILLILLLLLAACGGTETEAPAADESTSEETAVTTEATDEPASEETADSDDESGADHEHGDETHTHSEEVDLSLFYDGALAEDVAVVDCTLSDGTETMCYEITIVGYPVNHDVGPFCPPTTDAGPEEAGIWFDGNGLYEADGEFILGLAELYGDDNWKLYNDDGSVNVTETAEEFDLAARPNVDPSLQNHCVEGKMEWLANGEPVQTTVTIPINPVPAESASSGGSWGVTLNGVTIDASAPVNAILGAYTIATFDDCGGHINPVAGYHMHGARGCSEVGEAPEGETPIFGYAMDGYPIHSALSDEDAAAADLDECNGHATDELGYHYHANPAEENGVLTCFMGVRVEGEGGGRGGQGGGPGGGGRGQGGPPDFAAVAEILNISEREFMDALGPPPPDLEATATALGLTLEELQATLDEAGVQLGRP